MVSLFLFQWERRSASISCRRSSPEPSVAGLRVPMSPMQLSGGCAHRDRNKNCPLSEFIYTAAVAIATAKTAVACSCMAARSRSVPLWDDALSDSYVFFCWGVFKTAFDVSFFRAASRAFRYNCSATRVWLHLHQPHRCSISRLLVGALLLPFGAADDRRIWSFQAF